MYGISDEIEKDKPQYGSAAADNLYKYQQKARSRTANVSFSHRK